MKLFEFSRKLHDQCVELSKNIRFKKQVPQHLYLIALYGSIIELCGCLITLIDKKMWTGVPSLCRSMLEVFIDLKNLCESEDYANFMQASFHDQFLKKLKEAKKGENPYFSDLSCHKDLDSMIHLHEQELSVLTDGGYRPLRVIERFEKAGFVNMYRSIYSSLSSHTHSNISALIDRHYNIQDEELKVVYYYDKPIEDAIQYIDTMVTMLYDSTGMVHKFFGTNKNKEIEEIAESLQKIRTDALGC